MSRSSDRRKRNQIIALVLVISMAIALGLSAVAMLSTS